MHDNEVKVSDMDKNFNIRKQNYKHLNANMNIEINIFNEKYCGYNPRCQFRKWPGNTCYLFKIDKLEMDWAAHSALRCEECLKTFGK